LAWDALLGFLAARATPGVERVDANGYARTLRIGDHSGIVRVTPLHGRAALDLSVSASLLPVLLTVVAQVRRLFDLDAEPDHIASHLSGDVFGELTGDERGLRVPGATDGFELAIRAVLGQQVSVKGATTLMARLTRAFGDAHRSDDEALTHLPVTASRLGSATVDEIAAIGLPRARAATIHALAQECASGALCLEPECDVRAITRQLMGIPGVGPWTAEYIVMRAVHWPDAFPASDLVLCRAAGNLTPARLMRLAEQWRPWRAYAAMHLWRRSAAAR
jgi:AraC family transcriptional regulator of adaptative response / DNA-3-methyladenine glycosylase II